MGLLASGAAKQKLGLVIIVVGLATAAAFLYVRVAHEQKWAMLLVAVGWLTAFAGKTIRKVVSTREHEKMYLRWAKEAERDERAHAVADEGPHPAEVR